MFVFCGVRSDQNWSFSKGGAPLVVVVFSASRFGPSLLLVVQAVSVKEAVLVLENGGH